MYLVPSPISSLLALRDFENLQKARDRNKTSSLTPFIFIAAGTFLAIRRLSPLPVTGLQI
jgi:hypothetical protein